MMCNYS